VQLLALCSEDSGQGDVDPFNDAERVRDAEHEEKTVIRRAEVEVNGG
jgi:hypothetical protein